MSLISYPSKKNTIGKIRAAGIIRNIQNPEFEFRQMCINNIKSVFDNNTPRFDLPFSAKTRIGFWIPTGPDTKQFKEIDVNTETGTWTYVMSNGEPLIAKSSHGLLLELSRRDLIGRTTQTNNWGKFYVTFNDGKDWWNACEWKYYVAECFGMPIGKEAGRRRPVLA